MNLNKRLLLTVFIVIILGLTLFIYRKTIDNEISALLKDTKINFIPKPTKNFSTESKIHHIFVILEENHDWSTIYKNPDGSYINNTLIKQGAYASNYHNVPENLGELHSSELNYIFLEAGMIAFQDYTFTNDDSPTAKNSTASKKHLVTQLHQKGLTWKSYQEGILGNDCPIHTVGDYAPKHNPMIFFQDVSGKPPSTDNKYCKDHVRPLSELKKDLETGNVPNYVFITPNLQNDMHDGTVKNADTWLSQMVPQIINSTTFKKDGALFITWDEGLEEDKSENKKGNNPIGMIILSPFAKVGYTNNIAYSHASLLKTIQEIFQITSLLGFANDPQTQDLFDFFNLKK
ncbi:hypothetical protein HZA75_02840 [Candidatus Roizmanbacteria bacterium]|nr:hypothetical protein [Candidatus Roizmanbacteria bacterium]